MPLRDRTRLTDYSCFFITTTCNDWLKLFESEKYFSLLYDSLDFVNKKYNAQIVAYVFMPNHIHLIVYFHEENHLSAYMRDFKKFTSVQIRKFIELDKQVELLHQLRHEKREQKFKVWMDRFDDVVIRSTKILLIKMQYIHLNPVKKELVANPQDYKYSSAGFYLADRPPDFLFCIIQNLSDSFRQVETPDGIGKPGSLFFAVWRQVFHLTLFISATEPASLTRSSVRMQ